MKLAISFCFILLYSLFPQTNEEKLLTELKIIDIRGTLINKKIINDVYEFNVKSKISEEVVKIIIPKSAKNIERIYNFLEEGDHFYKAKNELTIRVGHLVNGNIEVRHFELCETLKE